MLRTARRALGGLVYHVLNRAVGRMRLFPKVEDFEAFRRVMVEAYRRHPLRILAYCILSNHWHFVVRPNADGQLTDYFRWLAHTHAKRWRVRAPDSWLLPFVPGPVSKGNRPDHGRPLTRHQDKDSSGSRRDLW